MCFRSDVMASLPSARLVCVALVTSLLVLYIMARGEGGHSDLDKREAEEWARLDLRALDLPLDITDRVKKVKSLGLKREKDAFAMPEEMLDLVSAHIDDRVLLFGEHAEKLTTKEDAMQLAKDLGKYALLLS